ncbi:MAG: Gldg family protein, partial [bacterium]
DAITAIILLLAILLVVNLISTQLFFRIDLSEGKVYTLSKASKEVVRDLEDKLTVKAFFTRDLPAPYNSNARFLRDMLDDYKAYSDGNLTYEFVDPGTEAELERQAQNFNIQPTQVNVVEKDKLELKKAYMGLVFLFEDKHETIPLVQSTTGLEYDITSTIKLLTAASRPKVGFLQGLGAPDSYQEMRNLRASLERNYELRAVDVSRNQLVPDDIDVLLIIGVKQDFDDWSKFAIDQFIMKGGAAAFLLNKVEADLQTSRASRAPFRIDDWTKAYGFKINDDLVMDYRCGMVYIQQRLGFFTSSHPVNYPFFPQVVNFNDQNPMVKDLENIMLFFPSTIDTTLPAGSQLEATPLFFTTEKSRRQQGRYDISPQQQIDLSSLNEGPLLLGAAVTGRFDSYFKDKSVPAGDTTAASAQVSVVKQSPETRVVVIGDAHLALDAYASDPSNIAFLMNVVDWLARDEGLIHIRSREVTSRPLVETSEATRASVKYANIFLPPILVILIGVVRWQIRRRRKSTEW